jgi:hypothetical protein
MLTRRLVYRLQLLLSLSSSVFLGREFHRTQRLYFTLSNMILHQPGELDPRIFTSEDQGGPVIPVGAGFHQLHSLSLSVCSTKVTCQSQNYVTIDGQSASLSWCPAAICCP